MKMVVQMFNLKTLQVSYSLAKLQDAFKHDPSNLGAMIRKEPLNGFNGVQNMNSSLMNLALVVNTNSGSPTKVVLRVQLLRNFSI